MRIQHTVVFRLLHPQGSPESIAFLADAHASLASIPGVRDFAIHRQVSGKSELTHQFAMEFADEVAYRAYNEHPVHVAFVAERWTREVADFQEYDFVDAD